MENPKENIVDKIYKLRKNFVIIGLTGRTGSGCTTVAKILQTRHPEEFKSEYREIKTAPINNDVRKNRIIYRYILKNWSLFLDENEKYGYAKQLRAQLNDDEQVLLYYNSLSDIGKEWIEKLAQKKRKEMCLMARFRMIKNIPYYKDIKGIQPQELFKQEIKIYKAHNETFFEVERG